MERRAPSASDGYDRIAGDFDAARASKPWEWGFFQQLADSFDGGARVLDCGCGSGHLGLRFLISKGHAITGVDGSAAMLALFEKRYPTVSTVLGDMRDFRPDEAFDAIIAWDSVFHLGHDEQAEMIVLFGRWLKPGGKLLFTSGPEHSTAAGQMFGVDFSYASFSEEEYRRMLADCRFHEIVSVFDEPEARIHRVWSAVKQGD